MKIKVKKSEVMAAIKTVSRAVNPKSPLTFLTGIKFVAEEGTLSMSGTDLELGITCTVPAEVIEPGALVLPTATVVAMIDKLPSGEFSINAEKEKAVIRYGNTEAKLNGFSVDEYPERPPLNADVKFTINGDSLCEAMSRVVYAASDDATKMNLCGVNFEVKQGRLVLVSTDGYRVALASLPLECGQDDKSLIIPKKAAEEISKIFKGKTVTVELGSNQVRFESAGITLISNVIAGKFVNYTSVIPKSFSAKVKVNPQELISSLERASVLADTSATVTLVLNDFTLEVITGSEKGDFAEGLAAVIDGAGMKIHFSAEYLIDAVKNAAAVNSDVELRFTGPRSQAIIEPVEKADINVMSIILPRVIKEDSQDAA